MHSFAMVLAVELVVVVGFMSLVFALAQRLRRYDLADIAWGLVFIVIAVTALVAGGVYGARAWLVTGLVTLWGLRLASHIFARFRRKAEEDRRYVAERAKMAAHPVLLPFLKIFLGQGLLALVVTLPVIIIAASPNRPLGLLDFAVVTIWLIGFVFEAVGDRQLTTFLAQPKNKGKLMISGLWRYTRHPNYFGEVTQWWAIGLLAVMSGPWGWLGLIGPAVVSYLIIFVSGVPLLEKAYAGRPDWEAYKARTNKLVPGIPSS